MLSNPDTRKCFGATQRSAGKMTLLSTAAILTAGCLIDGMIVFALMYLTDGRRSARALYGARRTPALRSVQ